MTIAYFSISGLDILGALDDLGAEKKSELIEWIYTLQVSFLYQRFLTFENCR